MDCAAKFDLENNVRSHAKMTHSVKQARGKAGFEDIWEPAWPLNAAIYTRGSVLVSSGTWAFGLAVSMSQLICAQNGRMNTTWHVLRIRG
jgi:hypothetical protein